MKLQKKIVAVAVKPFLGRYLSKQRSYRYGDIKIKIPSTVFHPGLFFSTKILIDFLKKYDLNEKSVLELGAGSGLISIYCAKQNANVTASDINPDAVEITGENAAKNNVTLSVIESDLFGNIPKHEYNFIIINPPYFPNEPKTFKQNAWFCGEKHEYFIRLFPVLGKYFNKNSNVIMILSEDCNLERIKEIADDNSYEMILLETRTNWLEKNFIYKIKKEYYE